MDEIIRQLLQLVLLSSAVMIAVLLLRSIFENKLQPKVLSMLWIIVLIRLIVPINISSPIHFNELIARDIEPKTVQTNTVLNQQQDLPVVNTDNNAIKNSDIMGVQTDTPTHIAINQTHNDSIAKQSGFQAFIAKIKDKLSLFNSLALVWIIGMVASATINIIKMVGFKRKLSDARLVYSKSVYKTMLGSKKTIGLKQKVFIYESRFIETPVTMGVFRPKIILPAGFAKSIEMPKLGLILLHELCHIKRKDVLKNYAWLFVSIVYWFNPIIYIAYKAYTDDIEYITDEMVLKSTHKDQRIAYSQSLIDAIKLAKLNNPQSKIALSFCTSKTKLRKRVENMIRPQEKRKIATVVSMIICVVLMVTCFTTACMKGEEQVESVSKTTDTKSVAEQKVVVEERKEEIEEVLFYETPESYQNYFEQGNVKLTVDAKIYGPEDNKLTSVALENKSVTQEDVDYFLDYFVGDAPLYEKKYEERTKGEIEEEITYWKDCIDNCKNNWDAVRLGDPYAEHDFSEDAIDEFNSIIDRLESEMKGAPDKNEYVSISRELKPIEEGSNDKLLVGYAQVKEGNFFGMPRVLVMVGKDSLGINIASFNYENVGKRESCDLTLEEIEESTGLTTESALAQVEEVANYFGIDEIHLDSCNIQGHIRNGEVRPMLSLRCSQSTNSIGMPYLFDATQLAFDDGEMSPAPRPPYISALVDETGIVEFDFSSQKEISNVVDENVDIMDFDKVIGAFENEIFNTLYMNGDEKREIYITRIDLSYMLISQKDSDEIIAIPVWDFRGYFYDPNNEVWMNSANIRTKSEHNSFLTINAIDGSIISRHLGY